MLNTKENTVNELCENNIRLVYFLFNKLPNTEIKRRYGEDLISEGMVGLVKAAKTYDIEKGAQFSTYAIRCINNSMYYFIRHLKRVVNHETVNMEDVLTFDGEGNELLIIDTIPEKEAIDDRLNYKELKAHYYNYCSELNENTKKICNLNLLKLKQIDIAARVGLSQSYVGRIIKKVANNFYKKYQM